MTKTKVTVPNATEALNFTIVERDGKWCLLTKDGAETLGCHDTKAGAEAQERAVQSQKNMELHTVDIDNVEIFAAGTWNGDTYSKDDLDSIVSAYEDTKDRFNPFLKLSHD